MLDADNLHLPIDHGTLKEHCHSSHQALKQGNSQYFMKYLPPKESWRMFEHFKDNVAYLDIETNGRRNDPTKSQPFQSILKKPIKPCQGSEPRRVS